jgi:hypothetical protein
MNDMRDDLRRAARLAPPPPEAFEGLERRREISHRRQRLGAAAVGLTVTLALVAGAVFAVGRLTHHGTGRPGDEGSGGLPRSLSMEAGEYSYYRFAVISSNNEWSDQNQQGLVPARSVIEAWWALDGSGRIEVDESSTGYGPPREGIYGPGDFPIESDLSDLSTNPSILSDQIRSRSAPNGASPQPQVTPGPDQSPETGGLWRAVVDLLQQPNATPELRAALFTVGQGVPGVQTVTGAQDPVGRSATALRLTSEEANREILFDPDTHQPMAFLEVGLDGTWSVTYVVVEAGLTADTSERPTDEARFFPLPQRALPTASTTAGL